MNDIVRKCRKCSADFSGRYCNACAAAWRKKNREKIRVDFKAKYDATKGDPEIKALREFYRKRAVERNPQLEAEKAKVRHKRWREKNPKQAKDLAMRWRIKNPDWQKVAVAELRDSYVAHTLGMSVGVAPRELIELKRELLITKRLAKQLNEALTEASKGETE